MGAVDAGLDTVATVAQLAGTAVSHLSLGNVGGIISMIVKLAQTARRNKKECVQLAGRVRMILDVLPYLQGPEEKAPRAPLDGLVAALVEAREFVESCQNGRVGRFFTPNLQASKLAEIQSKIEFYLLVFPLISQMTIIAAIDGIRIRDAPSQSPRTAPPPPPASQPVVPAEAAKDVGITWREVAAASTVTVVSKAAGGTVVYKATLQDGRHVAIKSFDGDEAAFRAELAVVSGLRHQHIVRLLCWWEGDGKRLLVYEYVGDGSTLRDHLRRGECASWRARTEVLLAAARAIEHVHCHAIVLGNVGSSNILLDATRKPRVSGFGASVVDAVGSRTGRLDSAAGDVRGFGVVMLEVLTGRGPVLSIWKEEKKGDVDVTLESFALPSIEAGKLGDVLDRRPAAKPTPRQLKALKLVADMAARCLSPSSSPPGKGPTISDVVAHLKEAHELICSDDTHKLA